MQSAKELICQLKNHAVAAFWSTPAAVFLFAIVPAFFGLSVTVRWVLAVTMLVLSLGILIWEQAPLRRISASLLEAARQAEADAEKCRRQILNLEEACGRMELERKNAEEEWKTQLREHVGRIAEEQARAVGALQQAGGLGLENERLLAEHRRLDQALSEASARRRLSETRIADFDRRLREVGEAHAANAGKLKESEQEVLRLKENVHTLRAESDSLRQNSARLQRELEVAARERSDTELRLSQMKQDLDLLRSRAEGAEKRVTYLESELPTQEQFVARREIEKLLQDERAVKRELESEKSALESRAAELEQQAGEAEQLIKELHERWQERVAESKPQVADHFTWKVNYFRDHEVVLNFVNRGLRMDLIDATSQPALAVEVPADRHLARNESATIRFSSRALLPQEFLVRIRMTAFAQEASFRIRPFADNKIERV
jgi:chromosome segregation ATPase